METNPLAIALISILGSVLVFMIGLLITMVFGLKTDLQVKTDKIYREIEKIREKLGEMLLETDYKEDKKEIDLKLDEHGVKILRLEIKVINGVNK